MLAQLFRQEISALRIVDADSRLETPDSRFPIPDRRLREQRMQVAEDPLRHPPHDVAAE